MMDRDRIRMNLECRSDWGCREQEVVDPSGSPILPQISVQMNADAVAYVDGLAHARDAVKPRFACPRLRRSRPAEDSSLQTSLPDESPLDLRRIGLQVSVMGEDDFMSDLSRGNGYLIDRKN